MRFVFLFVLFCSSPVLAQPDLRGFCRAWPNYSSAPDVDHVGDSAVPADIMPRMPAFSVVHIPVSINLAQRFNFVLPQGVELKTDVAMMSIYPDGRVFYQGEDVSDSVAHLCDQMHSDDRQGGEDALSSVSETKTTIEIEQ